MNATEASGAQKSLHENQVLRQADLEAKQREEKRDVERQLDDELHRGNREVENTIEQQKKLVCKIHHRKCTYILPEPFSTHLNVWCTFLQAIDAQNAKFDREILLHGKNLSEEEFEKLMKAHKAEIQALEANLDREKQRQKKTLNDKVRHCKICHCENSCARTAFLCPLLNIKGIQLICS